MMYEKTINQYEKEVLCLLRDIGVSDITVPFEIIGNKLIMSRGEILSGKDLYLLDIELLYTQCLDAMYRFKNKEYSLGIYGIFRSKDSSNKKKNYYEYLLNEFEKISSELECAIQSELILLYRAMAKKFKAAVNKYKRYFEEKNEFELLHGDLFSGNILKYNDKYVLIDFEYTRFGPKISEIAFLLIWDIISIPTLSFKAKYLNRELKILQDSEIITGIEKQIIQEVYIPLYVSLIILYVYAGRYMDSDIIKQGISLFASNYYVNMEYEND